MTHILIKIKRSVYDEEMTKRRIECLDSLIQDFDLPEPRESIFFWTSSDLNLFVSSVVYSPKQGEYPIMNLTMISRVKSGICVGWRRK